MKFPGPTHPSVSGWKTAAWLNVVRELKNTATCDIIQPMLLDEHTAIEVAAGIVLRVLDLPHGSFRIAHVAGAGQVDAVLDVAGTRFFVEVKSTSRSASVAAAAAQLKRYVRDDPEAAPLLVVPLMGDVGSEICRREGVNWIDLQGNASVNSGPLRIFISGRREKQTSSGILVDRDKSINPFGPKASRVAHALLLEPYRGRTQSELVKLTRLDKGYVSKVVAELTNAGYIENRLDREERTITVGSPVVLLDAWAEHYKPKEVFARGLIAARDGFDAVDKLSAMLSAASIKFALTGLPAAAHYARFGAFRRADVYVARSLPDEVLKDLHAGADERGRNVFIKVDELGTSLGSAGEGMRRFASPVLTYLDLLHLPERSEEARDAMRAYLERQWKIPAI